MPRPVAWLRASRRTSCARRSAARASSSRGARAFAPTPVRCPSRRWFLQEPSGAARGRMRPTAMRTGALLFMGLLLGGLAAAQEVVPRGARLLDERLLLAWRGTTAEPARAGVFELDPAIGEAIAAQLALTPPPVSREFLDGPTEDLLRYHGLPGGIVLGLVAEPAGELVPAL